MIADEKYNFGWILGLMDNFYQMYLAFSVKM